MKDRMEKYECQYRGKKIILWEYQSAITGKQVVYGYFLRVNHRKESWSGMDRGEVIQKLKELMDVDMRNRVPRKVK